MIVIVQWNRVSKKRKEKGIQGMRLPEFSLFN